MKSTVLSLDGVDQLGKSSPEAFSQRESKRVAMRSDLVLASLDRVFWSQVGSDSKELKGVNRDEEEGGNQGSVVGGWVRFLKSGLICRNLQMED